MDTNGQVIMRETKQRNNETNRVPDSNGPNRYVSNIHPNTKNYSFFSAPHRAFSTIDHIISHKASLNRYKKIELAPCILSDHHGLKVDFNNNRNNGKSTYSWKLNNFLLNNHQVRDEIKTNKTLSRIQ